MRLLLDTHLLLWGAGSPGRISSEARGLMEDPNHTLFFSPISLWEIAIKRGLDRPDFRVDGRVLRRNLWESNFTELAVTSDHALGVHNLPPLHKDPFDRLLIAQALIEGITLLTSDRVVAQYPGSVRLV